MPRTGLTSAEIREQALVIAQTQLREHGFEKLRLANVAKAIGVSHVALYKHFHDKSDLVDAMTEEWLNKMDAALDAVCESKLDVLKRIEKWYLTVHKFKHEKVKNDPEMFKAFDFCGQRGQPAFCKHMNNLDRQINGLLREAYAEKSITRLSVDKTRHLLSAATTAYWHPRILAEHLNEKRDEALKQLVSTLLEGLK